MEVQLMRLFALACVLIATPALANEAPQPSPDPAAKITMTHGQFMSILDAAQEQGVAACKARSVSTVLSDIDKQAKPAAPKK